MEQLNGRQHEIVALARSVGRVVVEDLAARFSVTPQTIRKDLNELCERRMLSRVHGGATIASGVENVGYDARRFIAQDEKRAIGEAAARIIPNGSSLFINIGTTTEEVARALGRHEELLVITNNLNVATSLYRHPGVDVIVAGGPVRRSDAGIVGGPAVDFIKQFKVDYAVIGVSAIDEEGALLDYDYREVMVSQAIMENAREIVLVADRSKLARSAPIRVGRLSQVDAFVTDRLDSEELAELCRRHEVRVVETGLRDEVQNEAAQ
ncbi:DeoR/GlpR family DNA-binding transcription regulator [Methylopila sp. Yamaguchi]|uniref:DeoR/GlpR family DNA-binding transcription regulator n=1 Tax=Methylopila sp. Yamaguchi TaxID=1437817 RepID=UPI000CBF0F5E|nr:DeoR/GlpR family DNA-binding transcription regulator [Methylopila sp. Yamaguchi]GBD47868.1 DeoR family transcriptional regulator [Methylopila sp. Yamaguchi]